MPPLEFNQDQLDALERTARADHARRLLPIMRANFPQQLQTQDDTQLEQIIAHALHRAAQWGVQTREASVNFVILSLLLDSDFDAAEPVRSHFKLPGPGIDAKINAMMAEFKWRLRQGPEH